MHVQNVNATVADTAVRFAIPVSICMYVYIYIYIYIYTVHEFYQS